MKSICFNEMNLGARETLRLIAFMFWYQMQNLDNNTTQWADFGYDLHYDEPYITAGMSTLYASDFEIAFDDVINAYISYYEEA